jgi:hypothetical protein
MYITRKRGDERAHKVVSHGCLPFECSRREVEYYVIRIVGENLVLIGAFPGIEILLDKRADVFRRRLDSHSLHTGPLSRCRDGGAVRGKYIPVARANAAPESVLREVALAVSASVYL